MLLRQDTPAHTLAEELQQQFPAAQISIDFPHSPNASCFLDIKYNQKLVVVEWREGQGFGITSAPELYLGEGPHEVYENHEAARDRVASLILSDIFTQGAVSERMRPH